MTEYGKQLKHDFLEKCKQNGTYKRVFEDCEDGTHLLWETIETLEDIAAFYLVADEDFAYNRLCEDVESCDDNWDEPMWFLEGKAYTGAQIKVVLEKCL